jgi:DNA polymerase-3 subunit chi
MIRISCYKTPSENLPKTFAMLAEKCFYGKLQTLAITSSEDLKIILDKMLWTYSKKHFIPHATNLDPLPEKQPIYITDKIENPNSAQAVIFINIDDSTLLDFLSQQMIQISSLIRIVFLLDNFTKLDDQQIKNLIATSSITEYTYEAFLHQENGDWHKTS